jgi:hypothetical protein
MGNPVLGSYQLTAHDNSDRLAFTGTISLVTSERNHLRGQCTVVRQQAAPEGLLDQKTVCEALLDGKEISFDFAPSMDDGGLLLDGQIESGRMTGIWRLDGFVTSPPLGRFEAVKQR